jgi:hypothetical protein
MVRTPSGYARLLPLEPGDPVAPRAGVGKMFPSNPVLPVKSRVKAKRRHRP